MPIQITCARCHASYPVDDDLRGKSVRCRECDLPVFVEGPDAAESEGDPEAAIRSQPRLPSPPPPVEPARPRGRAETGALPTPDVRRRSNRPLVLALLGGCLGLILLAVVGSAALTWLVWSRDRTAGRAADGEWPEPSLPGGPLARAFPGTAVTLHVLGADEDTREDIQDQLPALVDPGGGPTLTSALRGDRLTIVVGPVRDPDAFAGKLDFGHVVQVRGRTITLIARPVIDPPPGADPVAQALRGLKARNAFRRADAARHLKDMRPDQRRAEVATALEAVLNDPEWFVRDEAIAALGVWGSGENVPALLRVMNHWENRREAMLALGRLKDARAAEALAGRLEELADMHTAAEALIAMGPVAEPAVLKRLNHNHHMVRSEVCRILKEIGTGASLPALRTVVAENDFFVSGEAKAAIWAISLREGGGRP